MNELVVIALGGNAILRPGQAGTLAEQQENIRTASRAVAQVVQAGFRVVMTHGNGPQVGNLLLQNEEARAKVPPVSLDVCGAKTQGMLGYLLQQELEQQTGRPAVSLVTRVEVDPQDGAFGAPSKPVGPFYTKEQADALRAERGWNLAADSGRGWRRVVPSPQPVRILELEAIHHLVDAGVLVIACGGGGIPVAAGPQGFEGVDAVIDKDLSTLLLAVELKAERLLFLTDVPKVCIHYGAPGERALEMVTVAEAEAHLSAGAFGVGSMQPKVDAAVRFVKHGGLQACIAPLAMAAEALRGGAGTQFVR